MKGKPASLSRIAACCAVLLPFLLSSLIAAGVMPARAPNGAITLVICTALGPAELLVDPATMAPVAAGPDGIPKDTPEKDGPQKDGTNRKAACAWAAAHGDVAAPPPPMPDTAPARPLMPIAGPVPAILAAARATGLPPATGPPLSV